MTAPSKTIDPALLERLKTILGDKGWSDDAAELAARLEEERGLFHGTTPLVLKPADTAEVAAVMAACHAAGVAVVPQGGNTGLCGGAVPHEQGGELLLNLSRMNRVIAVDPLDYTMTVEAGCILQTLQQEAERADLLLPLSLGAEGTCQIGGNLATNAGGINVIRYGNARDLVLGLEVVLPDGRIWNGLQRLRKDNTGYDLKDLFVGSEGTLGIITTAVLKLFPRPRDIQTAFCAVPDPKAALELLARARNATGDAISAFELVPGFGMDLVCTHIPDIQDPLSARHDWYVLMELSSSRPDGHLRDTLEDFLGSAFEDALVLDAVLAESDAQRANLWRLRESLPEAQKYEGASIKHDVAVPVSRVAEFLDTAIAAVTAQLPDIRPCPFGHLGDGNIHFNLTQPVDADAAGYLQRWEEFNRIVHDIVVGMGGSISAEHGIGRLKVAELEHYADPVKIDLLRRLKSAIDPNGVLNPGKVVSR